VTAARRNGRPSRRGRRCHSVHTTEAMFLALFGCFGARPRSGASGHLQPVINDWSWSDQLSLTPLVDSHQNRGRTVTPFREPKPQSTWVGRLGNPYLLGRQLRRSGLAGGNRFAGKVRLPPAAPRAAAEMAVG